MVEDKRQPPAKDAATSDETERDGQKADGDLGDLVPADRDLVSHSMEHLV